MTKTIMEVGQQVFIETTQMFFRGEQERTITEYEVVRANKTSFYIVRTTSMDKYREDISRNKFMERRVEQRSHLVKGDGVGDRHELWTTEEEFHSNVKYREDIQTARHQAHIIVDTLSLVGLENLIKRFE